MSDDLKNIINQLSDFEIYWLRELARIGDEVLTWDDRKVAAAEVLEHHWLIRMVLSKSIQTAVENS